MESAEIKVLELIRANDKKLSWYQLEHIVYPSELSEGGGLRTLLRKLRAEGLIREQVDSNPSQPLYSITPAGVSAIESAQHRDADGGR